MADAAFHTVRVGPALWRAYRDTRLAALIDSPRAFGNSYAALAGRTDEQWRDFVDNAVAWLAMDGSPPLGTIALYADPELPPGEISLMAMWVAGQSRGTGVGDRLVEAALREAGARGMQRVVLEVAAGNGPAIRLYARHGFTATTRARPGGRDAFLVEQEMVRVLDS